MNEFSIEFDVDDDSLAKVTAAGQYADAPEYVYAIADTWLRVDTERKLLMSKFETGNLIETLRNVGKQLHSLSAMPLISGGGRVPRGDWCNWMNEYWGRIEHECELPEDDDNYEKLIPLELFGGRGGHCCAYLFDGIATFEVATRSQPASVPLHVWCEFDGEKLALEVKRLRQSIEL